MLAGAAYSTDFLRAHELSHQWWGLGVRPRTYHDAWLSAARAQGPLSDHEALIDLGVLRWRGALPSWASIGERWGWRPRSEVGPLLERFPTSALPDFAHVEVAHG